MALGQSSRIMSLDVQLGQLDIQGIRVTVKLSRPQDLEVFTRPVADPLFRWGGGTRCGQVYNKGGLQVLVEFSSRSKLCNQLVSFVTELAEAQSERWRRWEGVGGTCGCMSWIEQVYLTRICPIMIDLCGWMPKIQSSWTWCWDRQQKVCHAIQPEKQQHLH